MNPSPTSTSPSRAARLRAWIVILSTFTLLALYSSKPGPAAPEISLTFRDKLDHFCVFALIATLVIHALPARVSGTARWLLAFAIVSLYGFADELLQHFNPARTGDPLDWFADSLGALLAVVAYTAFPFYRRLLVWPSRLG